MMLASVSEVRADLGFDDMPDINEAITAALHGTTHALASVLRTSFDKQSWADLFFVERSDEGGVPSCDLRLSLGFVEPVSVVVKVSPRPDMADAVVVTPNFVLRPDKGVISDYRRVYLREFVQCSYTAGFNVDDTDPESYDLAQVPPWLQEAAKLHAKIMLDDNPSLKEAGVNQSVYQMTQSLEAMLESHIRYVPWARLPL
jgi:hypothetical protein